MPAHNTMFLLWCGDVLPKVYIFVPRLVSGTGRGFGSAPQQKHTRCAPGAGRVSVDGTRQTTQRLTSQTCMPTGIRWSKIKKTSGRQNLPAERTWSLYHFFAPRHIAADDLKRQKWTRSYVFLTVDSDSSMKNNGRLETSRELIDGWRARVHNKMFLQWCGDV